MPASLYMPDIVVEIAFDSLPDDTAPTWTDVSAYVEAASPITISRGRSDELTEIQPSRLTVTLDNKDGRFTPGNASSPYYPNVKKAKQIRATATPVNPVADNLVSNPSFEVDTTGWSAGINTTITRSTAESHVGTASLLLQPNSPGDVTAHTATGTAGFPVTSGDDYTAQAQMQGDVACQVSLIWYDASGSELSAADGELEGGDPAAFVRATVTATAPANATYGAIRVTGHSASGADTYIDAAMVEQAPDVNDYGDGDQAGWLWLGTAHNSASARVISRFRGYIDEWPVVWPHGTDQSSHVTVTASSRMARLAGGVELRSIIEEEYLLGTPTAYYPLGEPPPVGDGQAGDVTGNQQPNLVATGSGFITWQGATGPGTDALSAPVFADNGRYLRSDDVLLPSEVAIECFVNTTDSGTARVAVSVFGTGKHYTYLGTDTSGHLTAVSGIVLEATTYTMTSADTINDGQTHHIAVVENVSGGNVTAELFLDGVSVDTSVSATFTGGVNRRLAVGTFAPPGIPQSGGWMGSISHVAVSTGDFLTSSRIAAHAESGLTGFAGESSDQRIERLATYAGIDPSEVSTETGSSASISAQDTTGKTVIALMQEVTDTENGLLFDGPAGLLVFHARSHRYNAAAAFTLDSGEQHIEASLEARMDGQQLVNDVTATRVGGDSAVRVVNWNSIDEYGIRREQVELFTTSDAELLDAANWRVNRYGEPDVRISSVAVDLINQSADLVEDLLNAELGDRITLANLPAQAPSTSMDGFIEGISESIGAESYTIAFELSPVTLSDVWQLDSTTYSQLDETTVLAY